jgi:long-chain fatty acid transport protein
MLAAADAEAGGFEIKEQSASSAGTATAGSTALGEDASNMFYNPATMTLIDRDQVMFSGQIFVIASDFDSRTARDATGGEIDGNDSLENGAIPAASLFGVWGVNDRMWVGIGVTAPFGLSSEYDDDWVGRYNTQLSSIQTVDINPAVAVRLTDWLSLGAGLSAQHTKGQRRSALDFGSFCFNASGLGSATCTMLGLVPQGADGDLELTADDWGIGYNVGVLVTPVESLRLGLSYRSRVHHTLSGRAKFSVPENAEPLTSTGLFRDTGASADITLPDRLSLGVAYEVSPQLSLLGDVTWTNWSTFDELRVDFDNPAQPDFSEPQDWHDTFRYSVGARYQVTDDIVARAGFAFDETPIDDDMRTPSIPGNDRLMFALGAGYRLTDDVIVDFAYTYAREMDASVDQSRPDTGTISGEYQNRVHFISVQGAWRF